MSSYIHQLRSWPRFHWKSEELVSLLASVRHEQGRLLGHMEQLGFGFQREALLITLTSDIVKSSEIEGERLDGEMVRSSIARHLDLEIGGLEVVDRNVEGIVELMLDATGHYEYPLTEERLFNWHSSLFPGGRSGMKRLAVGRWRENDSDPMQVVSGPVGRQRVHYEAPVARLLPQEMNVFLRWFNEVNEEDWVIKASLAHLWFVTIHPFEDGNGRIARAIADMALARSENTSQRFYSMSAQIRRERKTYYERLEHTQRGTMDVTEWMAWFLGCLLRAIEVSQSTLDKVLAKGRFWEAVRDLAINARQRLVLNRLLDGFEGKMTTSKWAKLAKCSQDTAARDIQMLIDLGVMKRNAEGGRSTSYSLMDFLSEMQL